MTVVATPSKDWLFSNKAAEEKREQIRNQQEVELRQFLASQAQLNPRLRRRQSQPIGDKSDDTHRVGNIGNSDAKSSIGSKTGIDPSMHYFRHEEHRHECQHSTKNENQTDRSKVRRNWDNDRQNRNGGLPTSEGPETREYVYINPNMRDSPKKPQWLRESPEEYGEYNYDGDRGREEFRVPLRRSRYREPVSFTERYNHSSPHRDHPPSPQDRFREPDNFENIRNYGDYEQYQVAHYPEANQWQEISDVKNRAGETFESGSTSSGRRNQTPVDDRRILAARNRRSNIFGKSTEESRREKEMRESYAEELKRQMAEQQAVRQRDKLAKRSSRQQSLEDLSAIGSDVKLSTGAYPLDIPSDISSNAGYIRGARLPPGGHSHLAPPRIADLPQQPSSFTHSVTEPKIKNSEEKSRYLRELDEQVRLKKMREEEEKMKRKMEDEKKMQEIMNYNPFGKSGAGAPLRASDGSVITNRSIAKQMALSPSQLPPIPNFQQNQQHSLQQHQLIHSQAVDPTISSSFSDANNSLVQPALLPPNLINAGLIPGLQGLSLNPNLQLTSNVMNPHGILQLPVDAASGQSLQLPRILNHAITQGQAGIVNNLTTNNTPGRDKTTFLRGITDMNNLPPWQREEIIRKQNEQHAIQEALKQQMIEKEKAKAEAAARRKLEDQLEMERLKKEQEMLKLKYEQELEAQRKKDEEAKAANLASTVDRETKIKERQKKQEELYLIAKAEAEALKRKGRRRRAEKDENQNSEPHQEPYQPPSHLHPVALRPPSPPIPALRNQIGRSRSKNNSELNINSRDLYDSGNEQQPIQSFSPPIPTLTKSRNSQSVEQLNEYSIPEIPPRQSRTSILLPPQVYPSPHARSQNQRIHFASTNVPGVGYSGVPQHPANSLSSAAAPSRSRPTTTKWSTRPAEISQVRTQQSDNFQQSTQSVLAQLQALKRDLEIEQKNVEMSLAQPISVTSVSSTTRSRGMNERLPKIEKGIVSTDRKVAAINVEEKRPGSMSAINSSTS